MKTKKTLDQDLLEILKETNNPVFLLNEDLFIEDLNSPAAKTISKIKSRALHKNFADLFQQAQLSLPKNLEEALKKHKLLKVFKQLTYTERKEHIQSIDAAQKPETKKNRILKIIFLLQQAKV